MVFTAKNLKDVIDSKNPYDIFKFYCPDVSLDNNCVSPLRNNDNSPSFRLFYYRNTLLFNDFGLGEIGDIYKFVGLLYNLDFRNSIIKIYRDLKGLPTITKKQVIIESLKSKTEIKFEFKKADNKDIEFWKQYLNDLNTLNKFKIYPISKYSINGSLFFCSKPTYLFIVGSRLKIYQPGQEIKYIGNTNSSSIQGWNMLNPNNKNLLLVSSMKEVLVLYELGIQAIAPNSESSKIPPKIIKFLKSYWNIKILYDWDKAGRLNALKHSVLYNIPIHEKQFEIYNNVKDISDFRHIYGYNNLKNVKI